MAKKKTAAKSAAKKTVKKNTTKKMSNASVKKVVVKEEKKVDDITEALAEGVTSDSSTKEADAQVATNPTKDYYDISLEQINMYKETHNGEDPGLDLEEVKKDANDGFATIILDNDSADIPDDVKATINFADQIMSQAETE